MSAVNQEYLKHSKGDTQVVEAFLWWCDGKGIPCVRYEVEPDCLDILDDRSLNNCTFGAENVLMGYALPETAQVAAVHR
jgi:hypothetical protein